MDYTPLFPAVFSASSGYAVVNCIHVEAKIVFPRAFRGAVDGTGVLIRS